MDVSSDKLPVISSRLDVRLAKLPAISIKCEH